MTRMCLIMLLALVAGATHAQADSVADNEDSRILVTFSDPGMSNAARAGPVGPGYSRRSSSYLVSVGVKRAATRIARDFGLHKVDEWPIVPLKVHCLVYSVSEGDSVDELLTRLKARPEVESAQRLNRFEVSAAADAGSSDPYTKLQHNLVTLELEKAHSWSRGNGTSVTIIDTGADLNHAELKTQIRDYRNFVDGDVESFVADAHGTAVAGIIGAAANNGVGMVGVAPSASLTVLKACWYAGENKLAVCDSFTLAKALSHAVESGTDVINLSLGGPSDALLSRLVDLALKRGIVVVAAAPSTVQAGFPTEIADVIGVGSDRQIDAVGRLLRSHMHAPGDEILVPIPGGGFDYASGSSLSAAHVTGIVALLIAKQPGLTRDDVNSLLADSRATTGRSVNACRALARLLRRSGCREESAARQVL